MILYFQLWVKRRGNQKRTYEKKLFLISLFHRSFWRKKYNESSERDLNPHAGFGKRVCCRYITRAFMVRRAILLRHLWVELFIFPILDNMK